MHDLPPGDWSFLNAGDPGAIDALFGVIGFEDRTDLAERFRRHGWMAASLDPLGLRPATSHRDLTKIPWDTEEAARLAAAYCGAIGWEFGHVQDAERFDWLADQAEHPQHLDKGLRLRALAMIARAELFEGTLAKRLPMVKTFGLAGSEGFLVAVEQAMKASGRRHVIVGGMHRGRLTQMALLFAKPLARIIAEAKGQPDLPEDFGVSSDVPYHLGWEGGRADGLAVWVAPHPSHLSLSASVAAGVARGRGAKALPLMLHTDAAFAGQGVNAELLQLSGLPAYSIGGTVHIVLNNQIGFTTPEEAARTARSCADVAKIIEAPILHVNGNDPDAVLIAATAAARYRETFGRDVVLDVIGFRRPGHNEIDDPRMTQPLVYDVIDAMKPLSKLYAARLGVDGPDLSGFAAKLDHAFASQDTFKATIPARPAGLEPGIDERMCAPLATGVEANGLRRLGDKLTRLPAGFHPHRKVAQFLDRRQAMLAEGAGIDWATAEALALASLAEDGHGVRFSGQDSMRGAFTQRHWRVHDQTNGAIHDCLGGFGGRIKAFDTPLIENAVLGFEYGFSVAAPRILTVWEAQFGDFLNVCQAMFDQYVTGGEQRWLFSSGLVMLLPHGWDGGGPDHSTGHLERILARCAQGNIQVVNASTPSNYFHVLRRQMKRDFRKPLVVLSPKALLRHPACRSDLVEFLPGTGFVPVLDDYGVDPRQVERVLICSGKLHFGLDAERRQRGLGERVAIVRLEQLYPFPSEKLARVLSCYHGADILWVQEEPENLGACRWLDRRLERAAGRHVHVLARPQAAAPATGWRDWHDSEERVLLDQAFAMRI